MEKLPEQAPAPKKPPLYMRMFFNQCYVEIVRFVGYRGRPVAEGREFVQELVKKYGRDQVKEASEAVTTCEGKAENITVRLTAEARKLAWGLLGPPEEQWDQYYRNADGSPTQQHAQKMAELAAMNGEKVEKPKKTRSRKSPAGSGAMVPASPETRDRAGADPVPGKGEQPTGGSKLMQQYRDAKERHPGMLLLFRMGDFYELFDEDARIAAKTLGLTLTSRDKTTDMAGFPHHQLETYLHKLLKTGHRVALCDQVDSDDGKRVKREVTRVVTPAVEEVDAEVTQVGAVATKIPVKLRKRKTLPTDESIQEVSDEELFRREHELRGIPDKNKTPKQLEEMGWILAEIRRRARQKEAGPYAEGY